MPDRNFRIVGIGEVLWDLLPGGAELGGAPANFSYLCHALGAQACLVTRVGDDALGRGILTRFKKLGVSTDTFQVDAGAPTGAVTVTLSGKGVPDFTIHENVAWDKLEVAPDALHAIRAADAVCFGSLAQRAAQSRTSIQALVSAAPADALRVFDVNLRQRYFSREVIEQSLRLANIFKLNHEELPVIAEMFSLPGSTRNQIEGLAKKFDLRLVALTRGADGSLLYTAGEWSDCPSAPIKIADTVGAGDAFTAAMVLGLLEKKPLPEINALANEVARYICTRRGAMPPVPRSLRERFH